MNNFNFFRDHFYKGIPQDPVRDWIVLLMSMIICLAGIVVWNVWTFDTIASGGSIGPVATSSPPVFSRSSLDAVHAIFTDRLNESVKYTDGIYRYTDPSQ